MARVFVIFRVLGVIEVNDAPFPLIKVDYSAIIEITVSQLKFSDSLLRDSEKNKLA